VKVHRALGLAGRARGPEDEADLRLVAAPVPVNGQAAPVEQGRRSRRLDDTGDLGRGVARVDRHPHASGQPGAGHGDHRLGGVGELGGDSLAVTDARRSQVIGQGGSGVSGLAGGDDAVGAVQ